MRSKVIGGCEVVDGFTMGIIAPKVLEIVITRKSTNWLVQFLTSTS